MAEADTLTLAFLVSHPAEAARVLESLSATDAAALFARVPARAGAPVLAAMLPASAARTIGALDDATALAVLSATGTLSAVTVLRHVAEPHRTRLIEGLPTATAVASRLLLGYPEDSVGAWTDPRVIALGVETRAGEALERVRAADQAPAEQLYVLGPDQLLAGVVDLHALVRAPEAATLAALMRNSDVVLPAVTSLATAAGHSGWERSTVLPVVERGGHLLGVLRRGTLARALEAARGPTHLAGEATVAGVLARGYWDAVSGLAAAAIALLPPAAPVRGDEP